MSEASLALIKNKLKHYAKAAFCSRSSLVLILFASDDQNSNSSKVTASFRRACEVYTKLEVTA